MLSYVDLGVPLKEMITNHMTLLIIQAQTHVLTLLAKEVDAV